MTMTDPIADMLTRIRNAQNAGKDTVAMPHSELKKKILEILRNEGYISDFQMSEEKGKTSISIGLKYDKNGMPVIHSIERISKPGIKRYVSYKELRPVMGGMGIQIISTNKGVMTDRKAKREKVGGEVICKVW
ncbi:MAG: 30S ribosomal protein S8 [bacterium]